MANTNIKGITIEFNGDVKPLQKALRKVKDETKEIDKELKSVNYALKLDPKNVDLLKQKQELLEKRIKLTTTSLEELKKAQKDMDAAGVDKNSEQYKKLQREIIITDGELKKMNGELKDTTAKASKIGQLGGAFSQMGSKITEAGKAMKPFSAAAAAALGAFAGLAVKAGSAADDLVTLSKQTGISTDDLQLYAAAADLVDVSVETLAKSQQKLKKSMYDAAQGGGSADYFKQLGVSVTDVNGDLRDSNDVFQEVIKALGNMENETERDALAMQIFGKSAAELNPLIEDAGATYEEVAKMLSENGLAPLTPEELQQANDFKDSLDKIKLIIGQLVQIIGTKVAGVLQPIIDKVVDKVMAFAEWLANVDPKIISIVLGVVAAVAALTPVLMAVGTAISAVGAAMTFLAANPIVGIIAAITAVIGVLIYLIKHWDEVKAKATEVWEHVKNVFGKVADFFASLWDRIKSTFVQFATSIGDAISGAVKSAINGVISYIESTINKAIRLINGAIGLINNLPGVSIGTIGEINLPRLAKGGVLYGARPVIAGDVRGGEAIIPLEKLFKQMDRMAETINGGNTVINVYPSSSMDINALAREIERRIIAAQNARRVAWQ